MSSGRKCKFYSIGALRALVNAPINETQSMESNVITELRPSTCPTRKWRRKEKTRERLYNFLLFIKILRFIRGLSWHLIKKKIRVTLPPWSSIFAFSTHFIILPSFSVFFFLFLLSFLSLSLFISYFSKSPTIFIVSHSFLYGNIRPKITHCRKNNF